MNDYDHVIVGDQDLIDINHKHNSVVQRTLLLVVSLSGIKISLT